MKNLDVKNNRSLFLGFLLVLFHDKKEKNDKNICYCHFFQSCRNHFLKQCFNRNVVMCFWNFSIWNAPNQFWTSQRRNESSKLNPEPHRVVFILNFQLDSDLMRDYMYNQYPCVWVTWEKEKKAGRTGRSFARYQVGSSTKSDKKDFEL